MGGAKTGAGPIYWRSADADGSSTRIRGSARASGETACGPALSMCPRRTLRRRKLSLTPRSGKYCPITPLRVSSTASRPRRVGGHETTTRPQSIVDATQQPCPLFGAEGTVLVDEFRRGVIGTEVEFELAALPEPDRQ